MLSQFKPDNPSMASGIHSTIRSLQTRLQLRWVPKWREAFSASEGGYYERLGKGFKPLAIGQRRLVTQCRQLSIYSHFSASKNNILSHDLEARFEHVVERYRDPRTGLWLFSLNDKGKVEDRTCDLYALSFVIFACTHYFRASKDSRAKNTAREVLDLIDTKFRLLVGLAEALDGDGMVLPKMRRQNPHMHLLEACLFAFETWADPAYLAMADEMVGLFYSHFYNPSSRALVEFYDDDLRPHPDKGGHLEPGHYFEWVWLLKKHATLSGDAARHDGVCAELLDWANKFGWDQTYGGIYDTLAPDGSVIADTKRIWPFCEALKANALMLSAAQDRQAIKDRVADMVEVFYDKYMDDRGFWIEWLNRDLTPAADYMPGTTPYHVYFGITETLEILNARGEAISWGAAIDEKLYGLRRSVSSLVRGFRGALRG